MAKDPDVDELKRIANLIAGDTDTDILFFNGKIEKPAERKVLKLCRGRNRRKNILLVLVTNGGKADEGYRIARLLQEFYLKFTVYVPDLCKSAGTLITLGANEIVMSELAELGPVDVQMQKTDELWETSSGLTDMTALSTLQSKSFSMFEEYFLELKHRSGGRITLKTAMDIATQLTTGLYGQIFSQIEPTRLGEISRAMNIAMEYGKRLEKKGKNLKENAIVTLTASYPSHSFVIDRVEAKELFKELRFPTENEMKLSECLVKLGVSEPMEDQLVVFASDDHIDSNGETSNDTTIQNGQKNKAGVKRARTKKGQETEAVSVGAEQLHSNGGKRHN